MGKSKRGRKGREGGKGKEGKEGGHGQKTYGKKAFNDWIHIIMVLILVGNSEQGAHARGNIYGI